MIVIFNLFLLAISYKVEALEIVIQMLYFCYWKLKIPFPNRIEFHMIQSLRLTKPHRKILFHSF